MDAFIEAEPNMSDTLVARLKSFLEYEAKSCSMDFGCVTPLYVYRMWGGNCTMEEVEEGLERLRANVFDRFDE